MKFTGQGLEEYHQTPIPGPITEGTTGTYSAGSAGTVEIFQIDFSSENIQERYPLWAITFASRQAITFSLEVDNTESGGESWVVIETALTMNGYTDTDGNTNYSYTGIFPVVGFRKLRLMVTFPGASTLVWGYGPVWRY